MNLDELIRISRHYGGNPRFAIAGGGNTSSKQGDTMWIKASGKALGEADAESFVEMDLPALRALATADFGDDPDVREERYKQALYAARRSPELGKRPSVECLLHSLIPHRLVVHTHSTVANWVTCSLGGVERSEALPGVVWVPYVDPGFTLAKALMKAIEEAGSSDVILMENHGLIVSGETEDEIAEKTDRLLAAIQALAPEEETWPEAAPWEGLGWMAPWLRGAMDGATVHFRDGGPALWWANHPEARAHTDRGPMTPDQIVYCKSFPLWLDPEATTEPEHVVEAVRRHTETTGFAPKIAFVAGRGMFGIGSDLAEARTAADIYEDSIRVMRGAMRLGGVQALRKRDREFIDAWEVEQYRRKVAASEQRGRLQGKVAIVTGAAQGFGLGIAEGLIREGAQVVFADVNLAGAQEAAEQDPKRSMPGQVDVTRKESVENLVKETLRSYGGIDLLVSNAGVLRAESVLTQPEADFDLTTDVNYKGFFLCVQAVAPAMIEQRRAQPRASFDIVQVNSKSGLRGSNKNFAYAGSKFGAIGLVQSFALELIRHGIKVNAVCPGNFFDGPLWSDPENGLFVQYLRTGKVPGAKSLEDVRRHYENQVPMGRGCTPDDVVRAILYAVEQRYETGQAIPVTGGQEMLR